MPCFSQLHPVKRRLVSGILSCAVYLVSASSVFAQDTPKPIRPESNLCKEPRPQVCTENYNPVCGITKDGKHRTYGNACSACAHDDVLRYLPGKCERS